MSTTIERKKEELRKEYISIRNSIENKQEKSQIIMNKVIEEVAYKNAKVVALYKSLASEVDTTELIQHSIQIGKVVALPKVVNEELKFYKIDSLKDRLVKSKFGVEEPMERDINFIDKDTIDLVIVPGVCFDQENNRLGFGKGYYDRFLINTNLKTIAIGFQEQILQEQLLPITNQDVKMQQIITDKES